MTNNKPDDDALQRAIDEALGRKAARIIANVFQSRMRDLALQATATAGATMTELTRAIADLDGLIEQWECQIRTAEAHLEAMAGGTDQARADAQGHIAEGIMLLALARAVRAELQKTLEVIAADAGIGGTA